MENQKIPDTFEDFLQQSLLSQLNQIDKMTSALIQKTVNDTLSDLNASKNEEEKNSEVNNT